MISLPLQYIDQIWDIWGLAEINRDMTKLFIVLQKKYQLKTSYKWEKVTVLKYFYDIQSGGDALYCIDTNASVKGRMDFKDSYNIDV